MKLLRKICIVLALFIYIYSIKLTFSPIGPKTILDIIGLGLLLFDKRVWFFCRKNYVSIFSIAIVIMVWGFISMAINGSSELFYHSYVKYFIPWIGGAYCIYRLSENIITDFKSLSLYVALAVASESLFALVMKFVPAVASLADRIFEFKNGDIGDVENVLDYERVIGLGDAVFFGVLPSCTIGLISCVYLISKSKDTLSIPLYFLLALIIFLGSFFTARTSAIIMAICLLLLMVLMAKKISWKSIAVLAIIIGVGVYYLIDFEKYVPDNMLMWASSMDSNGTASHLLYWWKTIKFSGSTLIFGDAHYQDYYGGSDIGYHRQLFYGGIIGLVLVLFLNLKYCLTIKKCLPTKEEGYCILTIFVCYLVIMLKGDKDMTDLLLLYLVILDWCNYKKKITTSNCVIKNNNVKKA